jgi:hypothetical protein
LLVLPWLTPIKEVEQSRFRQAALLDDGTGKGFEMHFDELEVARNIAATSGVSSGEVRKQG